jgi:hypothetical protein
LDLLEARPLLGSIRLGIDECYVEFRELLFGDASEAGLVKTMSDLEVFDCIFGRGHLVLERRLPIA